MGTALKTASTRFRVRVAFGSVLLVCVCSSLGGASVQAAPENERAAWHEPLFRWVSFDYREIAEAEDALHAELARLPTMPVNQQSGRLGWEIVSFQRPRPGTEVNGWIEIDLGSVEHLDAVVLVPVDAAYREFTGAGYGFPVRFAVEASDGAGAWRTISDHSGRDFPNPGKLPVWLPCGDGPVRRVRISLMKPWQYGRAFSVFALGEIMLMRGSQNLAARLPPRAVRTSESFESLHVWSRANLVDGQSVLGAPVTEERSATLGYHSAMAAHAREVKWVQVDFGRALPIQEVRLIGGAGAQLAGRPGFGFPVRFRIEAGDDPDLRGGVMIHDQTTEDFPNPGGNPVTFPARRIRARYVRVTATALWERAENFAFALSELQVYSGGENVALGKAVTSFDEFPSPTTVWSSRNLTDGFTSERRLTEWSEWLRGLSRRREIMLELADVRIRRAARALELGERLRFGGFGLAALGLGGVLLAYERARRERRREIERLQQRIARDLHDEIGSNLGTIALLSEVALQSAASDRVALAEIHRVAREAADSMRDIVDLMHRPAENFGQFERRLREVAARMLTGLEWSFEVRGSRSLPGLEQQRHLLLALKEALHNVRRHADANRVRIVFVEDGERWGLEIADDGVGFDPAAASAGRGLVSLRHRAKALGGGLHIVSSPGGGTTLALATSLQGDGRGGS